MGTSSDEAFLTLYIYASYHWVLPWSKGTRVGPTYGDRPELGRPELDSP